MADDKGDGLRGLARGFRKRALSTAGLASRVGYNVLKSKLGQGSDRDATLKSVADLVDHLGSLKGLLMKVGQMASYLPGALPPEAQQLLTGLQSKSPPLAFEQVDQVLQSELSGNAATLCGRTLAVKVQYPGIEEVLRTDLRNAGFLLRAGALASAADGGELADELKDRLLEECDYRAEADHQRRFRLLFSADPHCLVPEVVAERSARRVLTSAFMPGDGFYDFCKSASQEEKNAAGALIFGTCFRSIFHHCIYNADPHPGNYLFQDGAVVFLDFGCIRRFPTAMIDGWKRLARAVLAGDRAGFRDATIALRLAPRPDKFDWDYQWRMTNFIYQPFLHRPFTYTQEYVRKTYDVIVFKNPNKLHQGIPREWLFLNRLQWGLFSVLGLLNATADWPTLWRDAIDAPTTPAAA